MLGHVLSKIVLLKYQNPKAICSLNCLENEELTDTAQINHTFFPMTLTKAQKEILAEIVLQDGEVNNYQQRLKAIRNLLDAGIIREEIVYDGRDFAIGKKFHLV